jgi:UDP-N-acetyl-D-glucosamine dehydrogenase
MPHDPPRTTPGPALSALLARIEARTAVVAVVGLGYVGLGIANAFARGGFRVLGLDRDACRVAQLLSGQTPHTHLGAGFAAGLLATGRFDATAEAARLAEADAILVCVPTPLGPGDVPDLADVRAAAAAVGATLRAGQLVVLESTTYPGTTREVLLPALLAPRGGPPLACGRDVFVAFSPEREDPGRGPMSTEAIPRLVGGLDGPSLAAALALYGAVLRRVVPVSSAEVAEAAKLLENIYRAVNIAMVNEMKVLLTAMGIDIQEVIDAAATKPFGFQEFRPGPGWGGHCIPIDPYYLAWKAREAGQEARFIALAGAVNRAMPDYVLERADYVLERARQALAARRPPARAGASLADPLAGAPAADALAGAPAADPLAGARVLVLGLAYKRDIDDVRESPSLRLLALLGQAGARPDYHDPHVPEIPASAVAGGVLPPALAGLRSVPLDAARLAAYDVVMIATDHAAIDWALVARAARLIVDTRGVLRGVAGVVPA